MKKFILMAAAISAFLFTYAQDESGLMDKLYPQIMQASQANDQALAKSLIDQLIEAGVDISELEATYAYALAGTGNLQQGIDRLNSYLKDNETDYLAYQALGDLYAKAGDEAKAFSAYVMCNTINPDYARPYVSFARMVKNKDKKLAMVGYNKAIRLFIDAGQPNGAVQLGVEAMEVDPSNVELLMSLGDALVIADMPDKAISFYNEGFKYAAAAKEKDYETISSANYKIAKLYADKGEYDAALTYLNILIDNEKYTGAYKQIFIDALNLAADCYGKKGDAAHANECRNKAISMQ